MEQTAQIHPPVFEDMIPLMERGRGTTYTIRSYIHGGGCKLIGRVYISSYREVGSKLWEEIKKDFPNATHIGQGKILNCNKIVPWTEAGEIPSYWESHMKLDKSGVVWERKFVRKPEYDKDLSHYLWVPTNGHYEVLGSIGSYRLNGRIWMDRFMSGRTDHFGQDDHWLDHNVPDPMKFLFRKKFKA